MEERNWAEAESLERVHTDWVRKRAQPALAIPPSQRDPEQRNAIRTLGTSLERLAFILREQSSPTCVTIYREALDVANATDDVSGQAVCAFNLGHTYVFIAELRNLDEAERWYRKSLDLYPQADAVGRGGCVGQLGLVAYERFLDARTADRPVEELARHLTDAAQLYEQALDMMPTTAVRELGTTHNQLGNIYADLSAIDRALHHYQQCIRYREQANDIFSAGETRANVAMTLRTAGRLADARAYAEAALANFRTFDDRAAADHIQRTERLIAIIDRAISRRAGSA
jgi:tetratricopeptide (TPR) repeat protein